MKITLAKGIESISGSFKTKNGHHIIFKTYKRPSANRPHGQTETRMYSIPSSSYQRKTPITEKEKLIRTQFKAASVYWNSLLDEQKQRFADEYKRSKCMFNGKKYATLRGYVIARFFAGALPS